MASLWYFYNRAGNMLRPVAVRQIAELTGAKVQINSFDFKLDGRVRIYGLSIAPGDKSDFGNAIVKIGRLDARFGLLSLLMRKPALKKITIKDFDINIEYDTEARLWNIGTLRFKRPSKLKTKPPSIKVRDGSVSYSAITAGVRKTLAKIAIDSGSARGDVHNDVYDFHIQSADAASNWITGKWSKGNPSRISLSGNIRTAPISLFASPLNIGDFTADMSYDTNDINVNVISVNIGSQTSVNIKGAVKDYTDRGDFLFNVKAGNLSVVREPAPNAFVYTNAKELVGNFIPMLQMFFDYFIPAGQVDIDVKLSGKIGDMAKTKCIGKIYCRDSSIQFRKFPYILDDITGELDVTENSVAMNNLKGRHGRVDVTIDGYSKGLRQSWDCDIRLASDNMLLDDDLYRALPKHYKKLWFTFSPSGLASGQFIITAKPGETPETRLEASLDNAAIASRYFPYPIENITGSFRATTDQCSMTDIKAVCNGADIFMNGEITETSSELPKYKINIKSPRTDIDKWLNKDLKGKILSEKTFEMISQLQVGGKVDLDIDISNGQQDKPEYKILVNCLNNTVDLKKFALSLKDITGQLTIAANKMEITNLSAAIANSIQTETEKPRIRISGTVSADANGINSALLGLKANDIAFDNRLGLALAGELKKVYRQIAPTGRFDLYFEKIKMTKSQINRKQLELVGNVIFKNCSFGSNRGIDKFNGELQLDGLYRLGSGMEDAEFFLTAQNVLVKKRLLENLKMPIVYKAKTKTMIIDEFVADCLGGKIIGSAKLNNSSPNLPGQYDFRLSFDNVDAAEFIRPASEQRGRINGMAGGELDIHGNINDDASHIGRLRATISKLKERPSGPIEKLQTAVTEIITGVTFTDMVMDSYIRGRELYIEQFSLYGPFVWLKGAGKLDLNTHNIDLKLSLYSFDSEKEPSFFESLTAGLSPALLKVEVAGNYSDPNIKIIPLPILRNPLGVIGTKK